MGIVELEQRILSMLVVEQAFICQNINLALQALGLGGWTFTGYLARFVMGGGDVPGLGFRFAEAADGSTYPVGRDGVFEAFMPAVLRRHERGRRPLHGGQVGVVRAATCRSRTSSRTGWWARCRVPTKTPWSW